MAQITGDQLFDKASFKQATDDIVTLIGNITLAIDESRGAAMLLSQQMGGRLKAEIAGLSSQSSTLSADYKKLTDEFNNFKTSVSSTNDVLKKYKAENDDLKKKVKDLEGETKKYTQAQDKSNKTQKAGGITANKLAKSLFGVAAGTAVLYKSITIFKDQLLLAVQSSIAFEAIMKEVSTISRTSKEGLSLLTKDAQRLGATTEKTSVQIGELQKELAKLGFTVTEILASSSSIVDLSTATGEDLAKSATVAASTLRAFGLEAKDMITVVDTMAGSFVRSGLDLEKFRESIKLVAPLARATNIDLQTTTAALSKLADAGLSGSLAGTALRNLFSNMADPTSKLANRLGFTVQNSDDLITAFRKLRSEGVDLAEAVQLVDVRARPAFFTLMNQVDAVDSLRLEYTLLDDEAKKLADGIRDTLKNDIEIATSAFDAMRRELVDGFIPAMREGTQEVTQFVEAIRFFIKGMKDGTAQQNTFFGGMLKGVGQVTDLILWVTMLNHVVDGLNYSYNLFLESIAESNEINTANYMLQDTTVILGAVVDGVQKGYTAYDIFVKANKAVADGCDETNESLIQLKEAYPELAQKVRDHNKGLENNAQFLQVVIDKQKKEIIEAKAYYDSLVLKEEELEKFIETNKENLLLTSQVSEAEILLLKTRAIMSGQLESITEIMKALNSVKDDSAKFDAEALENMVALSKITSDYNLELTKTSELKAKIKLDTSKGQAEEINNLEKYKITREKSAQASLQKELENINNSTDANDIKNVKIQIAYEKHKQQLLKVEESFGKDLMKLVDATMKDIDTADENLLQARIERAEKLLKFYENSFKDFVKLADTPPIKEEAWRNASSEISAFEKARQGGIAKFMGLRKESILLEEKAKQQGDSLNDSDMDRLLVLKTQLLDFEELTKQGIMDGLKGISQGVTMLFDNAQQKRENELAAVDKWEADRIAMAGDNAEAIGAIEKEAEEKRKQIKIAQAKSDKREALFQIAIATAINIVKAGVNVPKIILAAAVGLAQAAIVAAKPLPQFYKGTENSPEGNAWVGERGRELVKDGRTGKVTLTPNHATIMNLSKGSQVLTNEVTERVLDHNTIAYQGLRQANVPAPQSIDYDKMKGSFKEAVQDIPINITNFDEQGVRNFVVKGRSRTERLNKRYKY